MKARNWSAAALAVVIGSVGCSSQPANGATRGQVTLAGQPLGSVSLLFFNLETKSGVYVQTSPEGRYEVRSHKDTGLPPGRYHVAVSPRAAYESSGALAEQTLQAFQGGGKNEQSKNEPPKKEPSKIPEKYQKPETSGFAIEVLSGNNPEFNFDLTAK